MTISVLSASHRHLAYLDCGDSDADWNILSFLAADSHARIEREIVADSGDVFERLRSVTAQGRALNRRGYLAIFDQIRLRCAKGKLSVCDINLTAAKLH